MAVPYLFTLDLLTHYTKYGETEHCSLPCPIFNLRSSLGVVGAVEWYRMALEQMGCILAAHIVLFGLLVLTAACVNNQVICTLRFLHSYNLCIVASVQAKLVAPQRTLTWILEFTVTRLVIPKKENFWEPPCCNRWPPSMIPFGPHKKWRYHRSSVIMRSIKLWPITRTTLHC